MIAQNNSYYSLEDPTHIVNTTIGDAITGRASDIHFEAQRETLNIRFRIDGILHQIQSIPKNNQEKITSRIKVLSELNITEHRLPQDGHFEFSYQDVTYNIRVSILPSIYGESIVLRIFNREDSMMKLEELGFEPDQLEIILKLISSPSGMLLTTGPTGSGKTTLLYTLLHALNTSSRNIITVEDPVEFQMVNIRQTQINETVGLTFTKALRSVLRQDPDIIMLGEIRDSDTALMAVQASLTGIRVFTTFHTFDVPKLVSRLTEMNIPNSLIAQTIGGVISTRLIRKNCKSCLQSYEPSVNEKQFLGIQESKHPLQKGMGCNACKNTGYLGRTGIYEVISFDNAIRSGIVERQPASYMYEVLKKEKIKTLKESAIYKVLQNITTPEEIVRVLGY